MAKEGALVKAVKARNTQSRKLILEAGVGLNINEEDLAECRRLIEEEGANVNEKDRDGNTSLMWACRYHHYDIAELLLSYGASIRIKDYEGRTCLMKTSSSSSKGHFDIAELLISNGASVHDKDNLGRTCLILACARGRVNIAELLLSNGASVHDKDNKGLTCLMIACEDGRLNLAELLMSHGANIHDRDNQGHTCFSVASAPNDGYFYPDKIKILYSLRKWPTTMAILALQALALYHHLDCQTIIDLHQYLGKEDFTTDEEEDYVKDKKGNMIRLASMRW